MNCKKFESLVADWVIGRVPPDTAATLAEHRTACARCARIASDEEALRQRWRELPAVADPPDLWLRVSDRINAPSPRPRLSWQRSWAFGGAFALTAVLLVALLSQGRAPQPTNPVSAISLADEQNVVRMVADMKAFPDSDRDTYFTQVQDRRADEVAVLVGGRGGR